MLITLFTDTGEPVQTWKITRETIDLVRAVVEALNDAESRADAEQCAQTWHPGTGPESLQGIRCSKEKRHAGICHFARGES